ncbi:GtrA family protein [Bartonella apis]|uniref:GtrA family protein n=1 Tax=Bartonella apis TaxID=1686310 RepID=UPI000966EF10|nr:GtrA family protein [Bartonella apis]OLY47112.1 putative flippase GtrA (transmembrane translocase of bactoprenol-linked glucose) [Bartonella apis]
MTRRLDVNEVVLDIYKNHRSFVLFLCSGSIAFWIDFFTLWILQTSGLNLWIARACAFIVAATFTWIFNSRISFRGREARFKNLKGWGSYMGLAAIGGVLNYCASMTVLKSSGNVTPLTLFLAIAAGSFAGLFANYFLNHFVFFKKA